MFRLDKCCQTLNIIMSKPQLASYYFNTNDIHMIVDILIREATTNGSSMNRVQVYKLLETVLGNEVYKEGKYRLSDVKEMIKEQVLFEDETKKYSDVERECVANLNQFIQI